VNIFNHQNRSILSFSVIHLDKSFELTRFLINSGATLIQKIYPPNASTIDKIESERISSAFGWFVRSLMAHNVDRELSGAYDTLCLLTVTMSQKPQKMKQHVQRTMMQLGKSKIVNGPLFRILYSHMVTYWARPQELRLLAIKMVRKSMGPKRLANGASIKKLGLPGKLQNFVSFKNFP